MTSKNGLKMTSFDIFKFNHPYFTSCFSKDMPTISTFVKEVIVIFSHDPRVSVLDHWTLQFPASVSSMRAFLTFVCNISFRKQSAAAFDFQGFQREREWCWWRGVEPSSSWRESLAFSTQQSSRIPDQMSKFQITKNQSFDIQITKRKVYEWFTESCGIMHG